MPRPVIGISGSIEKDESRVFLNRVYMLAIHMSGGTPVLLSHDMGAGEAGDVLTRLDGLLLAGGNDVDPGLYRKPPSRALGEVNPIRDRSELMLLDIAAKSRLPVLGICRGIQVMNVAFGGTLIQDIPSEYEALRGRAPLMHASSPDGEKARHGVSLGGPLMELINEKEITVNSYHHQGIDEVAPGLISCAISPEGICEGVYMPERPFFMGVQWHPERTYETDAPSRAIFDGFVRASHDFRAERR